MLGCDTTEGRCRPYGRVVLIAAVLCLAAGPGLLVPAATPGPARAVPAPATPPTTGPTGGPSPAAPGAPSARPSATNRSARGDELYLSSCASCHGPRGQGTQRGPSLVGVGPASIDFQLGTGRMPLAQEAPQSRHRQPAFSAADIRAIVGHVSTFGGGGPQIPRVMPGDLRTGRELFLADCAACHSAGGAGAALTNGWTAPSLDRSTPVEVAEAVRVGPGLMPAFPDTILTDQQVDALASYVQQLRGSRLDRGGAPLGRLGPSTEGLVAWAIGLVLLVLAARWLGTRAGR